MQIIYLVLIEGSILPDFSLNWTKSAMMQNGKFSTLKISESLKAEKECLLLDFLEEEVEEKYYLSQEQIAKIIFHQKSEILEKAF